MEEQLKQLVTYIAILRRGLDLEKALVRQMAEQGDLIAAQAVQISDSADLGNLEAVLIVALVEQAVDLQLSLAQPNQMTYAKNGAKLEYLRKLRGLCPEGYEVSYFLRGGNLVKGCTKCLLKMLKAEKGKKMMNPVEEFKCGRKMKK